MRTDFQDLRTRLPQEDYVVMDGRTWLPPRAYMVVECRHCHHEQWVISPNQVNDRSVGPILRHECTRKKTI